MFLEQFLLLSKPKEVMTLFILFKRAMSQKARTTTRHRNLNDRFSLKVLKL